MTLGLLGEIVLRLLLQRHDFWRSRANLFDAGVVGISLLSSLLYYAGAQTRIEALFAEVLVVARVVFRLLRLLTATKSLQRQQQAVDQKLEVRFGTEGGGGSSEVLGLADDGFDEDDHERSSLLLCSSSASRTTTFTDCSRGSRRSATAASEATNTSRWPRFISEPTRDRGALARGESARLPLSAVGTTRHISTRAASQTS